MKEILFVFECDGMKIAKNVFYPVDTKDEAIQQDYNDWIDAINKGYWEEV